MSDAIHETQQDFWRPPLPVVTEDTGIDLVVPVAAEVCPRCGTEFLLGSRFCHTCGGRRPEVIHQTASHPDAAALARLWVHTVARVKSAIAVLPLREIWNKVSFPSWLHYLHFHEIKRWTGLPTASLISFVIGIGCVAGALLVGLLTAKTFVDWQAIQFYRAEWLLAATASFVAGILLKNPSNRDSE
jgi:hypothetical protein